MATLIVQSIWPPSSSKMLGEIWLGMDQPPDFMKNTWAGITGADGEGIKGLVLWQCEDSKLAEAFAFIRQDISRYFDVPGYTYSYNVWTEPEDALKMVGLM